MTSAVDRDLKTLVGSGQVRRLGYGLYCRARKAPSGDALSHERELLRAFLKTDDFLLASYDDFASLGLGLTPPRGRRLVYNHKRSGDIVVGAKRWTFRRVPEYPKKSSKEYLLVDLLNQLRESPGGGGRVLKNLRSRLNSFDQDKLRKNLERYGRPAAREILKRALRERRAGLPLRIVAKEDDGADLEYWRGKSASERVDAVELLRRQHYALAGHKTLPRLSRAVRFRERPG
ncbi:MAG: hypothetical protein KGO96_11825 [Elusimicrobia bacterium]|nr:hypothetical protein [Elusimicrobiota bacterium]MDE2426583.1 hypothetical protein [Elusimicrobiota bacterium]